MDDDMTTAVPDDRDVQANILVVEDDASSSAILCKILERLGFSVTGVVRTGEQAILMAGGEHPDLVLMDITLEGELDGVETASRIYDNYKIPVIYITGGADEETFERAKKTMPLGYILKPFNMDILRTTIGMALYRSDMEKKLKESEERNREILSSIPDIMFNLDSNGNILSDTDRGIARNYWTDQVAEKAKQYIERVVLTRKMEFFEYSLKKKENVNHYEARILHWGKDNVLVIIRDITEKKQAELGLVSYKDDLEKAVAERTAELSETNKFLMKEIKLREDVEDNLRIFSHTINQSAHCAVIIKADGTVEYVNRRFLLISGYSEGELVGISIDKEVNPILAEPDVWSQITSSERWKGELYNLSHDGKIYYLLANISAITNDEGVVTHYLILAEDITARKKQEQEISRARELIDKSRIDMADMELEWRDWKEKMMARNISRTDKSLFRNINNSFTQGAGFGSLISMMELLDSTARKTDESCIVDASIYNVVMDNVHVAQDAFKTFVNIDWVIGNEFELQRVSFRDIYEFVKVVIAESDKYSHIKKHRLLINDLIYGYNNIYFNINRDYLYKALYEGIVNAMKFSKPGTSIIVFVYIHNRNLVISIVNDPEPGENGIMGIPIEYGKVIFEPFYRLSKLVFEQYKTLDFGLGLTLIEKIVQKHGGEVLIHNVVDHTDLRREPQMKVDLTISLPVVT